MSARWISKRRMWRAVQILRPGMTRAAFEMLWRFNSRRAPHSGNSK